MTTLRMNETRATWRFEIPRQFAITRRREELEIIMLCIQEKPRSEMHKSYPKTLPDKALTDEEEIRSGVPSVLCKRGG